MNKKIFLLSLVLLLAGRLFAAGTLQLIVLAADGTETNYVLTDVRKIVFESDEMTVKLKSGSGITNVRGVKFESLGGITGMENLKEDERSISVFPNPVKNYLTITGVDKSTQINLLDLTGTLLQSIPVQDHSTNIDVSALQQGIYLLQIGEKVVKFIKQ